MLRSLKVILCIVALTVGVVTQTTLNGAGATFPAAGITSILGDSAASSAGDSGHSAVGGMLSSSSARKARSSTSFSFNTPYTPPESDTSDTTRINIE